MTMRRLLHSELRNVARSRWLIAYAIVLLGLTDLLFRFGGSGERVVLSLTNVILALVPLVGLVLGAMHVYQSREFIELMLAQPVGRRTLFGALYAGLALPLAGAYALGVGLPLLWHGQLLGRSAGGGTLLLAGVALTLVFTALAFVIALLFEERAAGLGAAIVTWLLTVVVYDGLLLLAVVSLDDWPVEIPAMVATLLNPVDLGRVLLLLRFDIGALAGYTGALFARFMGGGAAMTIAMAALGLWILLPLALGLRRFERRDW
jgi:Cu-processing system permease protein